MTELLTENLPLLSVAPNGIKKLRALILELAVRGKLVSQNPSDEPASDLLRLLAAEIGQATGRAKGQKHALPKMDESEQPFVLPNGWAWGRLGDVVEVLDNLRRPITKHDREPGPYPYYGASGVVDYVSDYIFDEPLVLVGEDGAKWGAGERTAFSVCGRTWVNNHAHVLRTRRTVVCDDYLVISLTAQDLSQFITGMTVPKLNQARLVSIGISLPPLAEQHRIVAKVDELMALCDRLEAQQADAESAHAQLVQALLDSLTQASDATDFAASWQRLTGHFHTLFTTESSIDAFKQSLLQLAAMGKLVPQDPSDEPARELLKRVAEEKLRLVAEGKIKKQNLLAGSAKETKPFALPEAWERCRVSDLISIKHGYAFSSSYFCESASQYVLTTPGNFFEAGGFRDRGDRTKYYRGPVDQEFVLDAGDLIVAMTEQAAGLLGSTALVPNDGKLYLHNQRLGKLIFDSEIVSPRYIFHYFNGAYFRSCVADSSTGMKVKHTSPGKIGAVFFPLPPLAEQHRIVAKVDQLMALCDQLKPRLTQARQLNEQLVSTLVEQAVA